MNRCLDGIPGLKAYIDDIVVYNSTLDDHIKTLDRLFQRLSEANLTINLSKSDFCAAEVKYLGYIVGYGRITPSETKIVDIQRYPVPKTLKGIRRFLGMAGYYRKFCKNFSD